MVHLEASWLGDRHTVESHKQVKLGSSLVSGVAVGSSHRIDPLEDGLYPTKPEIIK